MGRNLIAWVSKTCGHRQADSGRIKPGSETVNNPDPDSFRPQNQRSRTQNPKQTRAQPPVERGWADKADSRPPLRGPGGWGGDWYVWHAPDGLRARAATGLGCMQAGAEKLGVIEASYASAIIGVLSPVSSHCPYSVCHRTGRFLRTNQTFAGIRPSSQAWCPGSLGSRGQFSVRRQRAKRRMALSFRKGLGRKWLQTIWTAHT